MKTPYGAPVFRKRKVVTATGAADLVVPPAGTAIGFNLTLGTTISSATATSAVMSANIPAGTPKVGFLSIPHDDGTVEVIAYTSWTAATFTIAQTNFDTSNATAGATIGVYRANRVIVTDWQVIGHNTNATATTFTVRNKTTATSVLFGGSMLPTAGGLAVAQSKVQVPGEAGETIEINVAGAITGQIDIEIGGYFDPYTTPNANEYTGVP